MIEKKITAKIDKVIKTGSIEEEQVQELHELETVFPTEPDKRPNPPEDEQEKDRVEPKSE
jgi:hypothetical protein